MNIDNHANHIVGQPFTVPQRAWAPDGSHFVLTKMGRRCSAPPFSEFLFDRQGHQLARVTPRESALSTGHHVTWRNDSRWILIRVEPTGTAVVGFQYLLAGFVPTRTISTVVRNRVASDAFAGPGRQAVLSRFRFAEGASRGHEEGRVIEGGLVPG